MHQSWLDEEFKLGESTVKHSAREMLMSTNDEEEELSLRSLARSECLHMCQGVDSNAFSLLYSTLPSLNSSLIGSNPKPLQFRLFPMQSSLVCRKSIIH